ncbi:Ribosome-recycling factor, mitochondrial [Chionoecetes opilio]|uniref:Ribosome-recycling factor, mitochondrial n=1 Tax=Chionoecetes opilio TaxID=41210 RepID=A0A8J5CZY5_CHIOP|nr:Ribosome-recycling factor, mitochondrial [Chionoecetes opilio]
MALVRPALAVRGRLALSPSWSVFRAIGQGRGGCHGPPPPTQRMATLASRAASLLRPHAAATLSLTRSYAKAKDKKGKGKGSSKASVTDEEMDEVVRVERMKQDFAQLVDDLKEDYIKNLSLRTAAGSLETLPVQLEGDEYPLNELAQVARKSSQVVVISAAAFPQAVPGIVAAIRGAGMNLNPQQEGTSIIVALPKVTREHRESLAKGAKMMYNKCKEQLRETQNQYIRKVKNREGKHSDDLLHNAQLRIREMAEEHMQEAEGMMVAKHKELLKTS